MNNTIFGKMIQDYSDLKDFSIITYTELRKNYDAIYEDLLLARQAGVDFSADIQEAHIIRIPIIHMLNKHSSS